MELHFEVVGAEGPRRYFGALSREKLTHAYLFTGPAGVGKKTFARRLAQSLLCLAEKDGVLGYDGTCASCLLFQAQSARHPDFLEHEGVLKIGDRDASAGFYDSEELSSRDLVRLLALQSYSGGRRILLLGDLDFATPAAANALLKFVEEPPQGVVILLTSSAPAHLLPTIRSRAVEVRFPLLTKAQVVEVLRRQGRAEPEAEMAASLAGGSATRALAALGGEEESLRAQVARWFFDSVEGRLAPEEWASRETLGEGLETIKTLVRDWIVAGGHDGVGLLAFDYADRLRALRPLRGNEAATILRELDEAQRLARTNVSPAFVSELVKMALAPSG